MGCVTDTAAATRVFLNVGEGSSLTAWTTDSKAPKHRRGREIPRLRGSEFGALMTMRLGRSLICGSSDQAFN
jgi:hypothetical protein